ncbi:hypothetical protein HanRHA438_Chr03g0133741 [Helianthus annuus]|nr:hypothetical protein HanIR_Chr03g0133131 [Helianthus annuus]KAJ0936671.1 hypothetical protein HanRHA438_Chr03g0133741 [Helianthus annuus]
MSFNFNNYSHSPFFIKSLASHVLFTNVVRFFQLYLIMYRTHKDILVTLSFYLKLYYIY